jgi:hypothetical protein
MNMYNEIYQWLLLNHRYFIFLDVIYIIFFHVKLLFFVLFLFNEYLDVHIISFAFIGFIICTYLSIVNYYLANKTNPGYIQTNHDQQNRVNRF